MSLRTRLLVSGVPVTKAIGHVHMPYTHKLTHAAQLRLLESWIGEGDTLQSHIQGELTNRFIAGFWKHVAMYVGRGYIVEAIGEGVVKKDLDEWFYRKDYVRAASPLFCDESTKLIAASNALKAVGKIGYDWQMSVSDSVLRKDGKIEGGKVQPIVTGNVDLYCAEAPAYFYHEAMVACPFLPREIMHEFTYMPQDYEDATKFWRGFFDTRKHQ